jgi:hypothetical protein
MKGKIYHDTKNGFRIEAPEGWIVKTGFLTRLFGLSAEFVLPGRKWPNIGINVVGQVSHASVAETAEFAKRWLRKQGWQELSSKEITVDGIPAFEISYQHSSAEGGLQCCKVSIIKSNFEVLIEMAAQNLSEHKDIFDACVQSFKFD